MSKKSSVCGGTSATTAKSQVTGGSSAVLNRRTRQQLAAKNRKRPGKAPTDTRQIANEVKVITDDSYKDKAKRAYTSGMAEAKERIAAINARFQLPERINTVCRWFGRLPLLRRRFTSCIVINRDGKPRQFLPDKPGDHRILVHRSVARHLVSGVCMLVRITANEDSDHNPIDGSWAIVPAQYALMRTTTIQHLRRRPFFFLRRYWYEISFDARVQPAHMLFDYGLNPQARRTRFYITHEYVPVRRQDATNDYFRFWHHKPAKSSVNGGTTAVQPSNTKAS